MKLSIRSSILSSFAILLIAVCTIILWINYNTSRNFLIQSAENIAEVANANMEYQLNSFLQPAQKSLTTSINLLKNNPITHTDLEHFHSFLYFMLQNSTNISSLGWVAPNGDFYLMSKMPNNKFSYKLFVPSHQNHFQYTETILDQFGHPITASKIYKTDYNAQSRPWYKKALQSKKQIISDVYLFYPALNQKQTFGVTVAEPAYNEKGEFLGIFMADIEMRALSAFLAKMTTTPNSKFFIFDKEENLVAAPLLEHFEGTKLLKIENLHIPWVQKSLKIYQEKKETLFLYNFQHKTYLALYDNNNPFSANEWFVTVAITLPINDLIGPLLEKLLLSIAVALVVLIMGLICVWFIANSIAKPITRLASEANLIKKLDLLFKIDLDSNIKEIFDMEKAFNAMKYSLESFARYVPIPLVRKLIASNELAHVEGEYKTVTFLFSDITGFTALSEELEPQQLMKYLSEYLAGMTQIISTHQGTLDKYIGDAIMAFWNAPLADPKHAWHACQSALLMLEKLQELNKYWAKNNLPQINIRIGVNTGNATVGNVGSEERLSYTAIGDSVNLSNRIQDLNKIYNTHILVSETTYQIVKNDFLFRLIDNVAVRGKNNGGLVYELLHANNQFGEKLNSYNAAFQTAFNCYQQGKWETAMRLFIELTSNHPQDQLLSIYIKRCQEFIAKPPIGWTGVWKFI